MRRSNRLASHRACTWSEGRGSRAEFWDRATFCRPRLNFVVSPSSRRNSLKLGRDRDPLWPNLADFGRCWSNSANFGRNRPGQSLPISTEFGKTWSGRGQIWPVPAQVRRSWWHPGHLAGVGPISADVGPHTANLRRCREIRGLRLEKIAPHAQNCAWAAFRNDD